MKVNRDNNPSQRIPLAIERIDTPRCDAEVESGKSISKRVHQQWSK